MSALPRRLYGLILALHPAEFRNEFGREMALDFEEALEHDGFAALYLDAVMSVGRQWGAWALYGDAEQEPAARRSLLAGDYVMVAQGCLSLFDLMRASVCAAVLLLAVGTLATAHSTVAAGARPERGPAGVSGASATRHQDGAKSATAANHGGGLAVIRQSAQESRRKGIHNAAGDREWALGRSSDAVVSVERELEKRRVEPEILVAILLLTVLLLQGGSRLGRRVLLALLAVLALVAPKVSAGQILHADGPLPSFEVVTIRPWHAPAMPPPPPSDGTAQPKMIAKVDPGPQGGPSSDRVKMILPVQLLIAFAYGLPLGSESQVVGLPEWARQSSDQYQIEAKIEDTQYAAMKSLTPAKQREQVQLMEQALLADRFQLKVHFETREVPAYALVVAKGGPKLTPAKDGERSLITAGADAVTGTAVTMEFFARSPLLRVDRRTVVDQTGLKGTYDFVLKTEPGVDAASLFTLIQEQLGLKLVPVKTMVEVIVVDRIERPTEN